MTTLADRISRPSLVASRPSGEEPRAGAGPLSGARRTAALWLWLSTCVAVPAIFWASGGEEQRNQSLSIVTLLTVVVAATRLALLVAAPQPQLLTGTMWIFVYVALGVAPLAEIVTGEHPYFVSPSHLLPAGLLLALGVACFEVGAWLAPRGWRHYGLQPAAPAAIGLSRLRNMSLFAVVASLGYIVALGGPAVFFRSREEINGSLQQAGLQSSGSQASAAITTALGTVPALICLVAWICVWQRRADVRSVARRWLVLLLALNLVVNNPVSNSRYWFLAVIATLYFSSRKFSTQRYAVVLAAAAAVAILVFPHADYFRLASTERGPAAGNTSVIRTLATKDYDQTTMMANTIWWVDQNGHTFGRQAAGAALFWLPRSIWPGKPIDTGVLVGKAMQTENTNLSSPLWAELWIDFGTWGMALGFAGVGWSARRWENRFAERLDPARSSIYVSDLAVPFLAGYSFIILRGPILQATGRLAVVAVVLALLASRSRDQLLD